MEANDPQLHSQSHGQRQPAVDDPNAMQRAGHGQITDWRRRFQQETAGGRWSNIVENLI